MLTSPALCFSSATPPSVARKVAFARNPAQVHQRRSSPERLITVPPVGAQDWVGAPDPGAAVQEGLSRFVASLGIEAEQTGQTYDSLVRTAPAAV